MDTLKNNRQVNIKDFSDNMSNDHDGAFNEQPMDILDSRESIFYDFLMIIINKMPVA